MKPDSLRTLLPFVVATFLATGCQHTQLAKRALQQSKTLPDIQYQEVLTNLAMFSENSGALPYFTLAATGVTKIDQVGRANVTPSLDLLLNPAKTAYLWYLDKTGATLEGSQTNTEQWNTVSVLNPDELALMRCAYQRTVGSADCDCQKLKQFFAGRDDIYAAMTPGWFCVGKRSEVPSGAAFVGHHGKTYVWVMPENLDSLTRLTLGILDIGTYLPPDKPSGQVVAGDPDAGKLNKLMDEATRLADLLNKDPSKRLPGAVLLQKELDSILVVIYKMRTGKKDSEIRASLADAFRRSPPAWSMLDSNPKEADVNRSVDEILDAASEASKRIDKMAEPTLPALRPRKPLAFPITPFVSPPG